jgi:spore coat protein U-like protein
MRKTVTTTIAAGVLLALAGTAQAVTKTDNMTVSASVAKNCVIDAPDLNLGSFDGTNDLAVSSVISVRCTSGTGFTVDLSTGASGSYAARTMSNGTGGTLVYNLFTDANHTAVWGDGVTGGTDDGGGTGAGMALANAQSLTVYGQLLASDNQEAEAGSYTDTITATIEY